jgi:hypothetical protein
MAHLHLGMLAYWVVNTIRYQLKKRESEDKDTSICPDKKALIPEKMNFGWRETVRIMNTQKSVLTVSQNRFDQVIISRRCSDPGANVEAIYNRLHYKSKPFTKRKFVVHKSDFQKIDLVDLQILLL